MRRRILIPRVLHLSRIHTSVLKLRPYQETCLGSCIDALKGEGSTGIGASPPTRAGEAVGFVSPGTIAGVARKPRSNSLSGHRQQYRIGSTGGGSGTETLFPLDRSCDVWHIWLKRSSAHFLVLSPRPPPMDSPVHEGEKP